MTAGNALQHKHSILYHLLGLNIYIIQNKSHYAKVIVFRKLLIQCIDMFIMNLPAIPYKVPAQCDGRLEGYKAMFITVQHARARQGQR